MTILFLNLENINKFIIKCSYEIRIKSIEKITKQNGVLNDYEFKLIEISFLGLVLVNFLKNLFFNKKYNS